MPQTSPRILVVRLDAIGDALALTPLLAAFRERAFAVDVVLSQRNVDAFSNQAARRRLIAPFALRDSGRANLEAVRRFGAQLRVEEYTHALVATEDLAGYRLAEATGPPVRVGFANGWGKPLKTLWIRSLLTRTLYRSAGLDARAPHECEVLFRLGETLLGPDAAPTRDASRLRPLVLDRDPVPDARIAFQVTDKWERLNIAFDEVVALARRLRGIRALASAREAAYADAFASATGIAVERFDGIEPWKEAIAAARALVAPDSGALHVAGMVGTPTVAIFPPSRDLALQSVRWSPWAAPSRIVVASNGWPGRAAVALAEFATTA
jgi:ADP-heptose:LPS heptosyltransferase